MIGYLWVGPGPIGVGAFLVFGDVMSVWLLDPNQEALVERESYQIFMSAAFSVYTGKTAFGNAAPLTIKRDPSNEDLAGKTYVFRGGVYNYTSDPTVRQVWLDSGLSVITVVP